ncbi:hypothetical protein V6Z11_A07G242300 [Gossypium hirsutum]
MTSIPVQSGLKKVITGKKPENLNKTEWEELDEKALSAIQLCLANTVLQEVLMEKTSSALWKRTYFANSQSLKRCSTISSLAERTGHAISFLSLQSLRLLSIARKLLETLHKCIFILLGIRRFQSFVK